MAGIGWNIGEEVATAPSVGSGWSKPLPPNRQAGIGFVIDEPNSPSPMASPPSQQPPASSFDLSGNGSGDNSPYLTPDYPAAHRNSFNNGSRRPIHRMQNRFATSCDIPTPEVEAGLVPERPKSGTQSRCKPSRNSCYPYISFQSFVPWLDFLDPLRSFNFDAKYSHIINRMLLWNECLLRFFQAPKSRLSYSKQWVQNSKFLLSSILMSTLTYHKRWVE